MLPPLMHPQARPTSTPKGASPWRLALLPVLLLGVGTAMAMTACRAEPGQGAEAAQAEEAEPLVSPQARLYAYFVVNGMARNALLSRRLGATDMPTLLKVDNAARHALENAINHDMAPSENMQVDKALSRYLAEIPPGSTPMEAYPTAPRPQHPSKGGRALSPSRR
ncbi:hypothetical protein E3E12_08340 [Formicincola oecophyllae]|uniref:Uncharacterized protein n=1 Tax=Formicincola oecophyllae TaxID=2558361 RepID=A0A4Y6U9N9_9PROT|nr:hypothetical protein [Formicincola oecophyllae]QDH14193.2 hypothetical protein E3E12_08340 [Formicincola oecophyllae]